MRYSLILVFMLSLVILLAYTSRLEASESAKFTTEEVCDNPVGCPFVEGKCIGCVTKETHGPAPIINNNTTNNYNKTEIHNHTKEVITEIVREVIQVPVTTELKIVHEMVTITEPVERLRPYISVNDNDKISILGARHLGNNVWKFNMKVRGKHSKCSSPNISPIFTGGSTSCANEFFHYSIDWE
jgi:hypothetical protein